MTQRFAWVDSQEMFSLVLARDAGHEELADALTDGTADRLASVDTWPASGDSIKFVTGQRDGWAFALAFDSGLLPDAAVDAVARRWDTVSVWFDIHANSEFRFYRDAALIRRCSVIGYDFEPSDGNALPEERGLFVNNVEWDQRSDGLELVARVTHTEPSESWWTTAPLAWAVDARF